MAAAEPQIEAAADPKTGDFMVPDGVGHLPEEEDAEDMELDLDVINRETDEGSAASAVEGDPLSNHQDIPYDIAVRVMMETVLCNTLVTKRDWKNNPSLCDLCLEDETIDQKQKVRGWHV